VRLPYDLNMIVWPGADAAKRNISSKLARARVPRGYGFVRGSQDSNPYPYPHGTCTHDPHWLPLPVQIPTGHISIAHQVS
jgi:hypothetical protein